MKKLNNPAWISPEKRMKKYKDFGCISPNYSVKNVKWTKFSIIVPTKKDADEIKAAMEYFHDFPYTDTDFVTVNQLVHQYEGDAGCYIIIDKELYKKCKIKK